jgi:hypothetical protein
MGVGFALTAAGSDGNDRRYNRGDWANKVTDIQ